MPAWPGGPCPQCGDVMPRNTIHCRTCRALLNPDLRSRAVETPAYVPLREISCMVEVRPAVCLVRCSGCGQQVRLERAAAGQPVRCQFCENRFEYGPSTPGVLVIACPYCQSEFKTDSRLLHHTLSCPHCTGTLQLVD